MNIKEDNTKNIARELKVIWRRPVILLNTAGPKPLLQMAASDLEAANVAALAMLKTHNTIDHPINDMIHVKNVVNLDGGNEG